MNGFIKNTTALARLVFAGVFGAVGAISPALAADTVELGRGLDIKTVCGTKPMVVGLSDGFGGNTWRKENIAELKDELSNCPNVTKVIYTNANGDPQKAISDINGMVAQGANILLAFPDFGDAQLPSFRAAYKAGVSVVPYSADVNGKSGRDFTANVHLDSTKIGEMWADWFGKTIKTGNVVVLGGIPGANSSQAFFDGFKQGLKQYPGLILAEDQFIVTNWNPADARKAVAGLIAKHPKIDGIAGDFGDSVLAAVKVFEESGQPVPAIAEVAGSNELNCKWQELKKAGKQFPMLALEGTTITVRFAARRAIAEYQGISNDEPTKVVPYVYVDTGAGKEPKCFPSAPPAADFSGLLTPEQLQDVFKQ
jgi:ribose transport system substrate-binding protein